MPICRELLGATKTLADYHRLQRLYAQESPYLYPANDAEIAHCDDCLGRALEKHKAGEGRLSAEQQQLWEEFYGGEKADTPRSGNGPTRNGDPLGR